jgi:septal ring factor EnvC (AmiA/AmiB activator)
MEGTDMPTNENDGLGELRADVRHIQSDVTDIKAEIRVANQRIESLRKETGEQIGKLDQKLESFGTETSERFWKVDQMLSKIKESLASAKFRALSLFAVGLTGALFYALARGFKWL